MIRYSQNTWQDTLWIFWRWKGSVYRIILYQTILASVWGVIVSWIPRDPSVNDGVGIPTTMHSFSAVALGFLLVYRARIAYERFWRAAFPRSLERLTGRRDGRTGFSLLVSLTRDLVTQLIAFVDTNVPEAARARAQAVRLTAAFLTAATMHAHSGGEIEEYGQIEKWLTPEELERFKAYRGCKPVIVGGWLRASIHSLHTQGYIQRMHVRTLDPMISNLLARFGALDAIVDTPVPFPYVQMLQVSMFVYFIALPFVFLPILGSDTKRKLQIPFIMAVFSFVFYGLKSIATELEDPFGDDDNDLPLDEILEAVERDVRACVAEPAPGGDSFAEKCAAAQPQRSGRRSAFEETPPKKEANSRPASNQNSKRDSPAERRSLDGPRAAAPRANGMAGLQADEPVKLDPPPARRRPLSRLEVEQPSVGQAEPSLGTPGLVLSERRAGPPRPRGPCSPHPRPQPGAHAGARGPAAARGGRRPAHPVAARAQDPGGRRLTRPGRSPPLPSQARSLFCLCFFETEMYASFCRRRRRLP